MTIESLFAKDVSDTIEEVIKVKQDDVDIVKKELQDYVVTDSIRDSMTDILERYNETPNKPHEGVGIWVSGFFGSGKSSFVKNLGFALQNRELGDARAGELLAIQSRDDRVKVLLTQITERIPTEAVVFDVSTDKGVRSNQDMTQIMYQQLLSHLGYADHFDLAELEWGLETDGMLDEFEAKYRELYNTDWNERKRLAGVAVSQASRVMHELDSATYPAPDAWWKAARDRADITAGRLAERALELIDRRHPGKSLVFVVDEVGQFVARDSRKMLDLQGVVESLGRVGRGRLWLMVTSQEKLTDVVSGLDDTKVELPKLMDRFPLQVDLQPSDIAEVTSKRLLSKSADGEQRLRQLFQEHRGRLEGNSRLAASQTLAPLTDESFIRLYPLLPYQIDLIIKIVSGLRTQGGATQHVGGANRTIIKLAWELLNHSKVELKSQPIGTLARLDQVYDLVSGNVASEIRDKIAGVASGVKHPHAPAVAKVICLLQFVPWVHRTAENIAASLLPGVDADSCLAEVKDALKDLQDAHLVRLGDDGYRIPSPAEDDWERQRAKQKPRAGDVHRIHQKIISGLWQPTPSFKLEGIKSFKAGLFYNNQAIEKGDVPVHIVLATDKADFDERREEGRRRSQDERSCIVWVVALDEAIDRATVEFHRSQEIVQQRERTATTSSEGKLLSDEKRRLRSHQDDLRDRLAQSILSGAAYFRGTERGPEANANDVRKATERLLAQSLPEVYDRYSEAAATFRNEHLDALLKTANLAGFPSLFSDLNLLTDQGGQRVFRTEEGPLLEVFQWIENEASYGKQATGKSIQDHFAKEPYGWDADIVRVFVVSLLRAGKLECTSGAQVLESTLTAAAQSALANNSHFRTASFRPRKAGTDVADWADAASHFESCFGRQLPDVSSASAVAGAIREELAGQERGLQEAVDLLRGNGLPGLDAIEPSLEQLRALRTGKDDHVVQGFNAAHQELKDSIKRAADLTSHLPEPKLMDLRRASKVLRTKWRFLQTEEGLSADVEKSAVELADLLARETFFRQLADIDRHARCLDSAYREKEAEAREALVACYGDAVTKLKATAGMDQLEDLQRTAMLVPLERLAALPDDATPPIPQMRAERDACEGRLREAITKLHQLVDGNRIEVVAAASFFEGGVDTEERLADALEALRQHCLERLAAGKKILVR